MIDLRLGDCLEVMKTIKDNSIDAIITDPPYGTTACKWDSVIDFELMWEQLNRIIKPNGAIVLFGSEPFSSALRMSNIKNYKYDLVWDKQISGNFANAKIRPMTQHENISIFSLGTIANGSNRKMCYFPQMSISEKKNIRPISEKSINIKGMAYIRSGIAKRDKESDNKVKYPTSIVSYSKFGLECNPRNRVHPTQKPVALMEYLIKTYTNEGELVLDFTMGSGSTGVACKNTNRNFIGIEMDDNYFKIAEKRINKII